MGSNPVLEGIEVELLECPARLDLRTIVRHEQLAIHQMNVRFDTAKAAVQRIEQRARVFVIIMGMSPMEDRNRGRRRRGIRCLGMAPPQQTSGHESHD